MERDELILHDFSGLLTGLSAASALICIVLGFHCATIKDMIRATNCLSNKKLTLEVKRLLKLKILEDVTSTVPERPLCPAHCCPCCRQQGGGGGEGAGCSGRW